MNRWCSTFIPGFGEVVNDQLRICLKDYQLKLLQDGLIVYDTSAAPEIIKNLRFLNNSFLVIREFTSSGEKIIAYRENPWRKPRDESIRLHIGANPRFARGRYDMKLEDTAGVNPRSFIKSMIKATLKDFPTSIIGLPIKRKTFRVIFSLENELIHVDNSLVVAVEENISNIFQLIPDRATPDLEFWFLARKGGYGFFGIRISKHPDYKKVLSKGQLRPELANLLCLLSEPSKDDAFLDPFAGSGAIPNERKLFPYEEVIGGDIQPKNKSIQKLNALNLKQFKDGSIDKIVTDPPWGISVGKDLDLNDLYTRMLKEFWRVLKPSGLLVILMGNKELFENVLTKFPGKFNDLKKLDILVSGKKAAVYKLQKR